MTKANRRNENLKAAAQAAAPDYLETTAWAAAPEYLGALDLEKVTGTSASTWRYFAMLDKDAKSDDERCGPASFKIGRRRVWKKSVVLAWLARQEKAAATA